MYIAYFDTLFYSGLRKGEAHTLKWSDINFIKKEIRIIKSLIEKENYKITTSKNKSSELTVLINDLLIESLLNLKKYDATFSGLTKNCIVFCNVKYFASTTVHRSNQKYASDAGLKIIKIHDFRHSHASYLIYLGAPIMLVAARLGHSNVTETLNRYGHLYPNKQLELIDLMNKDVKYPYSYKQ